MLYYPEEPKTSVKFHINYGIDNALKSREIAVICDEPERVVRLNIRELIAEGIPIASSTDGKTGGYFIASTRQEAADYMGKLRHRIIQDCLRYRDFKRAAQPLLNPGQLSLNIH